MKARYVALDGLRGIAAGAVALFHFSVQGGWREFALRGNLAVDFFFALSGFVLAHAYLDKLRDGRLGLGQFVVARLIRLWPMIALSMVLGFALRLAWTSGHAAGEDTLGALIGDLFTGVLLIPQLASWHDRLQVFPLNLVIWSVWWELAMNLAWAAVMIRWPRWILAVTACVALALTLPYAIHANGMGFGFNRGFQFLFAGPRTCFSFLLGVLLYDLHRRRALPDLRFVVIAAMLAIVLIAPPMSVGIFYDLIAITVTLPFIVLLGASCRRMMMPEGLVRWLGEVSFPLYAIHYPLLWAWTTWTRELTGERPGVISLSVLFVLVCALATAIHAWIDVPVRRRLTRWWDAHASRRMQVRVSALPN